MLYLDTRESASQADSFLYYRSQNDFGFGFPKLISTETIYTQNSSIVDEFTIKGYKVKTLSEFLGLSPNIGLYELFSYYFEGKIQTDFDMIQILFNGFLFDSSWCFCLKIGVTFCWFTVDKKQIHKLGYIQFSEPVSKYSVGKFIKKLRFSIAKSGINLNKVKYLMWNSDDLTYEFSKYLIKFDYLEDFFSKIDGLKNMDCVSIMKLLSKNILSRYSPNAETFVDCLNDSFSALAISESDGILYSRNIYYKDYSSCVSSIINRSKCSYGIILDCEGKVGQDGSLNNGLRELGGIIYCKYNNVLLNLNSFSCDELLLNETLEKVFENYRELSGLKDRYINVVTYGTSDVIMLNSSCSKKVLNRMHFYDARPFINDYITKNNLVVDGRSTLTNIARAFEVLPIFPKHSPINDARTLFNILAKVLQVNNKFLV